MATTAMATAKIKNKIGIVKAIILLSLTCSHLIAFAEKWTFKPSIAIDETVSDNIELTPSDPKSSSITQAIAALHVKYNSGITNLNLSGTKSYSIYSHDSQLNTDYQTLSASGLYSPWSSGPSIFANASIQNVNTNNANNNLADLVSGDTVETQQYSTGLRYNFVNSSYSVQSSITYSTNKAEDSIGESDGISAQLSTRNGNNARHIYWQMGANYNRREQELGNNVDSYGENYTVNALVGAITPWKLNPFIRFQDEYIKGTGVSQDLDSNSSWGAGIRWLASPHITIDLSYNFVADADETASDDYIAASLQWQPSARTSLTADYNQRFFGKAYNLNLRHKTRRLTNTIAYNETLSVFDRYNYQESDSGELEPVESNQYSLNRRLTWSSSLQLSRTNFNLNISTNERENLETSIIDGSFNIGLNVTRNTGTRTNVSLGANFSNSTYDKNNPEGSRQDDYYRILSAGYNIRFARSLSSNFILRHVNRSSSNDQFGYKEVRATINIKKAF
jgi:uncharacterized protein (PEP-CTERM system associated)